LTDNMEARSPITSVLHEAGGQTFVIKYRALFEREGITANDLADESTQLIDVVQLGIEKRGDALKLRNSAIKIVKKQKLEHAYNVHEEPSPFPFEQGKNLLAGDSPAQPSVLPRVIVALGLITPGGGSSMQSFDPGNATVLPHVVAGRITPPDGSGNDDRSATHPSMLVSHPMIPGTSPGMYDPISEALVERIRNNHTRTLHVSTLATYIKAIQWYEETFDTKVSASSPAQILLFLDEYISSSTHRASTKLRYLNSIFAILEAVGTATQHVLPYKRKLAATLRTQDLNDRKSGRSCKFVVITYKDNRHLLNCVLERFGCIPFWHLFRMVLIGLGQNTGRRAGELIFIAAGSWSLAFSNSGRRSMEFKSCYRKMQGIGIYTQKIMEPEIGSEAHSDGAPSNAILSILAYFEAIGMIPSAIEVYAGRCPLVIDGNKWETADVLFNKLQRAQKAAKEHNIHALKNAHAQSEEDVYPESILSKLEDEDRACSKLPFFVSYDRATKRLSSKRFNFRGRRPVSELLEEAGYTPSVTLRAGLTGTRKYFRQCSRSQNDGLQGLDVQSHLLQHQSHGISVALERYENAAAYTSKMAANITQPTVGPDAAREEVHNFTIEPAYYTDGFFSGRVQIRRQSLHWERDPTLFFALQAKTWTPCACPGISCNRTFQFHQQLAVHMDDCSGFCCNTCLSKTGKRYKTLSCWQAHKRRCNGLEQQRLGAAIVNRRENLLDFMMLYACKECQAQFPSRTKLQRHLKDVHYT
jgi:hypothetical protein